MRDEAKGFYVIEDLWVLGDRRNVCVLMRMVEDGKD